MRRRTQARHHTLDPQRDDAPERVAVVARLRDRVDHRLRLRHIGAPHIARLDRVAVEAWRRLDVADDASLAPHGHAHDAQDGLRHRARGHASCRLARARALDDVAHVRMSELQRAGEVGMTRPQTRDRCRRIGHRLDAHHTLPVDRVAIRDLKGDRRAGGPPVAHPGGDGHRVALNALPGTASVAELTAMEVRVDVRGAERERRGDAVDDRDEPRPV